MEELERLIELLAQAVERLKRVQEALRGFQELLAGSEIPLARLRESATRFAKQVEDGAGGIGTNLDESQRLAKVLQQRLPAPAAIKPDELAKRFRSVVETLQREARAPAAGDFGTTLKSMDVEVKGLIVVEADEARIVTPSTARPVDPGQLSTVRMSFASIPLLQPPAPPGVRAPEEPPTPPAAPERPARPSRRRAARPREGTPKRRRR